MEILFATNDDFPRYIEENLPLKGHGFGVFYDPKV